MTKYICNYCNYEWKIGKARFFEDRRDPIPVERDKCDNCKDEKEKDKRKKELAEQEMKLAEDNRRKIELEERKKMEELKYTQEKEAKIFAAAEETKRQMEKLDYDTKRAQEELKMQETISQIQTQAGKELKELDIKQDEMKIIAAKAEKDSQQKHERELEEKKLAKTLEIEMNKVKSQKDIAKIHAEAALEVANKKVEVANKKVEAIKEMEDKKLQLFKEMEAARLTMLNDLLPSLTAKNVDDAVLMRLIDSTKYDHLFAQPMALAIAQVSVNSKETEPEQDAEESTKKDTFDDGQTDTACQTE